jgi:hypothetical protein
VEETPPRVQEYADQVVEYVRRAIGVPLEYNSDTLPLLDHYLRTVADSAPATMKLIIVTAGAYFGEVVRRHLGGRWDLIGSKIDLAPEGTESSEASEATKSIGPEGEWRVVLPTGLNFSPLGFVAAAIANNDVAELDNELEVPVRMREIVQETLGRMGEVPLDDYYSLCNRLDTLEHVHEVLVAYAAQMLGKTAQDDLPEDGAEDVTDESDADGDVRLPVADEPSGGVN